jgi:hypothetical protein
VTAPVCAPSADECRPRGRRLFRVRSFVFALVVLGSALASSRALADSDEPAAGAALPPLPPPAPSAVPAPAPISPPPPAQPAPLATGPASPPPAPPAVPTPPCVAPAPCGDTPKTRSPGSGFVGLRTQVTGLRPPGAESPTIGVTFAGRLESHNDDSGILASRAALDFGLGGGTANVEGIFGGALLLGARTRFDPHRALFLRLGLSGEFQSNSRYLYSRFDLPLGELGYQRVRGGSLFEVGGRVSPVLTGRLLVDDAGRSLTSSFSAGAFATARGDGGLFSFVYTRVTSGGSGGPPVDTLQALGCILPFGAFAMCLDGQVLAADLGGRGTLVGAFGALVGFGGAGLPSRDHDHD